MEDLGLFGSIIWIYGYRFGANFEWIFRDGHLIVYMKGENTVLETKKISYEGKQIGYKWDYS